MLLVHRYTFLSMWVVGVPMGMYLVFIARPSFDLFGLWVGLLTGTSSSFLRAIIMILDA